MTLLVLLTLVGIGMLSLSAVELRRSGRLEARSVAMANARMGLMMALGQLQLDLGDDRRITADASIFTTSRNPAAVGVWNGWSPNFAARSGSANTTAVNYATAKSQSGFRSWLVSAASASQTRQLTWHTQDPAAVRSSAPLFTDATSGFSLSAEKVPCKRGNQEGTYAWAVTQENTKARINLGVDEGKRLLAEDRLQTPSRPDLTSSGVFRHPANGWPQRAVLVHDMQQAALDSGLAANPTTVMRASRHFTTSALSLLTNPVTGGMKVDLTSGFEMSDADFRTDAWSTAQGTVRNPFRGTASVYKGQRTLFQPVHRDPAVRVMMNFNPASVDHKFEVNGVPTFETLRNYYRIYRHLYEPTTGGLTVFERPYSHIASSPLARRPFGVKSQPSIQPVVDRVYFIMSIMAQQDGTLGVLVTPFVTLWNPHNIALESEGVVVYPWIDFAVFWNYSVTKAAGGTQGWSTSLSRLVGEGYQGNSGQRHGRSSRPYFYFHVTDRGTAVPSGTQTISPAIRMEPGEVKVFCLAENVRRDLETSQGAQGRTWRMKSCTSPTEMTQSLKNGVFLNLAKAIPGSQFTYRLQPGDRINANTVTFDRNNFNHITGVADAWQIKNPGVELMASTRPADGFFPQLPEQPNLNYVGAIHSLLAASGMRDSLSYPSYQFEEIRENPRMVGGVLTYHRTANAGATATQTLAQADLMFTTNPRQAYINSYLSGGNFQASPHYETLMIGGTSLVNLAMETSMDGRNAYYGLSHSANRGRTNPVFFEVPRSPTLSLGSLQHCDIATTPFTVASQIGNSWASPYLPSTQVTKVMNNAATGEAISPGGLAVYDYSYLANEVLFDGFYFSGAAPEISSRRNATASTQVWDNELVTDQRTADDVLADFFANPTGSPLRNPRMMPYPSGHTYESLRTRLSGPAKSVRLAAHLFVEGGFNINSTSEEAWVAVLSSLRGAAPASADRSLQSRFRHTQPGGPVSMRENDGWSGFRTLTDAEIRTLARNIITEVRLRGPFLSLGEFVNRRISSDRNMNLTGALQSAIDRAGLNRAFTYSTFDTGRYPNPENLPTASTGMNTPGWLSQADLLQGLAPFITPRSDTFLIRSLGEAKNAEGVVTATVRLEATMQRVPDWIDPTDDAATAVADLRSPLNRAFGRKFRVLAVRELVLNSNQQPQ